MIEVEDALVVHKLLVEQFGGAEGIRDLSALESALQRPFQTFDGVQVYQNVLERAAALIESLLINHPFIDGNKRTGYVLLRLYLIPNGLDIRAPEQAKYEFIIAIAAGEYKFDDILIWLTSNTITIGST